MKRTDGNEITGTQSPLRPLSQVGLRDLFNDGLGHGELLGQD
jgi:hypothetical protein